MLRRLVICAVLASTASIAHAQPAKESTPKPSQAKPPAASADRPRGQPINVKIEVGIMDQAGTASPTTRNVVLLVADGHTGGVRSTSQMSVKMGESFGSFTVRDLPLNIDAEPVVIDGQKLRLKLTMNMELRDPRRDEQLSALTTRVTESVTAILESGKPVIIAQSADPVSDRRVTVEVKATILK